MTDSASPSDLPAKEEIPQPGFVAHPCLQEVLDQVRQFRGEPLPCVPVGRKGLLKKQELPIPGWLVGKWNFEHGRVGSRTESPSGDFRALWLATTGQLVWILTKQGILSDDSSVIVVESPGDFYRNLVPLQDVGEQVWEDAVGRIPALSRYETLPLEAFKSGSCGRFGGMGILIDPVIRAFNEEVLDQIRKGSDPSSIDWTADGVPYSIRGWSFGVVTDAPIGRRKTVPSKSILAHVLVTDHGEWIVVHREVDGSTSFFFYDTVADFHWHSILLKPSSDPFHTLWNNALDRYPILKEIETHGLRHWDP